MSGPDRLSPGKADAKQAPLAPKPKPPAPKPKPPAPKSRAQVHTCDRDTGNDTCGSIELEPSVTTVDFGRVFVGQQAVRTFAVTNTDPQTAIEIEETQVVQPGFGDFEAHGTNAIVEPRQLHNVTVAFRPTQAGAHAGEVRVRGDFATSPPVALRGIGDETNAMREKRVERQDADTARIKRSPNPTLSVAQNLAEDAVEAWQDQMQAFARGTAAWTHANWIEFYGSTGADFTVAWTEGHFNNILGDALSNLAGLVTEHPLVSFVMSTLSSLIWDAAFTEQGNRENEDLVHEKTKKVADAIGARLGDTEAVTTAAMTKTKALASTALHRIWSATEPGQVEQVQTWAKQQATVKPPRLADRTLASRLLRAWTLERARGATGDSSANRSAYADARSKQFGLAAGDDFKRRDLFVFQARHDWMKLSLGRIDRVEGALHDSVKRHEAEAKIHQLTGAHLARFVAGKFDYQIWSDFEVRDRRATAAALNTPEDKIGSRISCRTTLAVDGESVVAKHFYYMGNGATHAVRSP